MLDFSEIKLGSAITFEGKPCVVVKCDFIRMQQRKPVKRCIMKNLANGKTVEYAFKSGESVEEADMRREKATFLYEQGAEIFFMSSETYETIGLPKDTVGDKASYLKDGLEVNILNYNDKPIAVELPIKVSYKVVEADPGVRGNTATNLMKNAKLETGREVRVPIFIEPGTSVIMNTVEDEYVGKGE